MESLLSPAAVASLISPFSLLARLGKSLLCLTRDSGHAACSLRGAICRPEVVLPQVVHLHASLCGIWVVGGLHVLSQLSRSASGLSEVNLSSPSSPDGEGYSHLSAAGKIYCLSRRPEVLPSLSHAGFPTALPPLRGLRPCRKLLWRGVAFSSQFPLTALVRHVPASEAAWMAIPTESL